MNEEQREVAERLIVRLDTAPAPLRDPDLNDEAAALLRELAGVEVLPCAPTYTEQQIADACMAAEVPDSKCESVLLALRAQRCR